MLSFIMVILVYFLTNSKIYFSFPDPSAFANLLMIVTLSGVKGISMLLTFVFLSIVLSSHTSLFLGSVDWLLFV